MQGGAKEVPRRCQGGAKEVPREVLGRCWGGATCGSPTRLGAMPERVKLPSEAEPEASRAMTLISTSVWRSCHGK